MNEENSIEVGSPQHLKSISNSKESEQILDGNQDFSRMLVPHQNLLLSNLNQVSNQQLPADEENQV